MKKYAKFAEKIQKNMDKIDSYDSQTKYVLNEKTTKISVLLLYRHRNFRVIYCVQ